MIRLQLVFNNESSSLATPVEALLLIACSCRRIPAVNQALTQAPKPRTLGKETDRKGKGHGKGNGNRKGKEKGFDRKG